MFAKKYRISRFSLCVFLIFSLCGCTLGNSKQKAYEEAMLLYDNENYAAASRKFKELKNYRDSEDYYNFSAYEDGMEKYNKQKYSEASLIFNGLGDYKDSANYAIYCSALDYIACGKYTEALENLAEIRGFLDVDKLFNECEYNESLADKYSEYDSKNSYYYDAEMVQPATMWYEKLEEYLNEYVYHGKWFEYGGNDILNISIFNCNGTYRILSADVQLYRGSKIEIQFYYPYDNDTTIHTLNWYPYADVENVPYSEYGYLYLDNKLYSIEIDVSSSSQQSEQLRQYLETYTVEYILPYSDTTYLSIYDLYGLTAE